MHVPVRRGAWSVTVATATAVTILATSNATQSSAAGTPPSTTQLRHAVNVPVCPQPTRPGEFTCMAWRRVDVPAGTANSYAFRVNVRATISEKFTRDFTADTGLAGQAIYGPAGGYTPAALAAAYDYNPDGGRGMTVAIVDWNDSPAVRTNLQVFDRRYHLGAETSRSFRVVNEYGNAAPLPPSNIYASEEINLDVQAVRAVCHYCSIVLVEANATKGGLATADDLARAENTAVRLGADVVSNSYGAPEPHLHTLPAWLTRAYHHPGVVITASSGDGGWFFWDGANEFAIGLASASFPASSPSVVSVGGTTLTVGARGRRLSETVWNSDGPSDKYGRRRGTALGASGGGCSVQFAAPFWQQTTPGYRPAGCDGKRLSVDVAAVADPATGFDVYDRYGLGGWATLGGTSLSSPVLAGMYALARGAHDQDRPARALYQNLRYRKQYLYDVTSGGNGWCGGDAPGACAANSAAATGHRNPNAAYGALVDCSFARRGSAVPAASNPECTAVPGFDGASGVGAPASVNALRPTTPTVHWVVRKPVRAGSAASFHSWVDDPVGRATVADRTWRWGDGTVSTSAPATVAHTYAKPGRYRVTLTVTDSVGQVASLTQPITVP